LSYKDLEEAPTLSQLLVYLHTVTSPKSNDKDFVDTWKDLDARAQCFIRALPDYWRDELLY